MSGISAATPQTNTALINAAQSQAALDRLKSAPKPSSTLSDKELKKIDKTATDFEAVFLTEMLKPMFAMMKVDDTFGGGKGEEVFRDFSLNEYGKKLSESGGIGIAKHIKDELIRLQEFSQKGTAAAAPIAAAA